MEYFRALFLDLYSKYQENNCLLEEKMLVGNVSRESHGDAHVGLTLQPRFPGDGTVLGLKEGVGVERLGRGLYTWEDNHAAEKDCREGPREAFLEHSPPGVSLHKG